jgi:hypothetical protein
MKLTSMNRPSTASLAALAAYDRSLSARRAPPASERVSSSARFFLEVDTCPFDEIQQVV